MNYEETVDYLYRCVPMFQKQGSSAYKEGLSNTHTLDKHFNYPHREFKTVHIGGTNGKGSTSHTIAAILQAAGYRVGLYTSPHLIDFRERIRINGEPINKQFVVDFIKENRSFYEPFSPSFFELTTAMAFRYFADNKIDVAIIEVGLGGRLDCTNIISPDLAVITNISNDHNQFLGNTLEEIAAEKGGIIKSNTPIVIGEYTPQTKPVFKRIAEEKTAPILFASDLNYINKESSYMSEIGWVYQTEKYGELNGELGGIYQLENSNTVLAAIDQLIKTGYSINTENIRFGFSNVTTTTGLMGRWQELQQSPRIICDTGHNVAGIASIVEQLKLQKYTNLHLVIGIVDDKDVNGVLALLPVEGRYYFTKASVTRALDGSKLSLIAAQHKLKGNTYNTVKEAVEGAMASAEANDLIFIGGSSFIVADLLEWWNN